MVKVLDELRRDHVNMATLLDHRRTGRFDNPVGFLLETLVVALG